MFAAAATFVQMGYDASLKLAKYIAERKLLLLMLYVMLPWVLRGVFIWGFDYVVTYGKVISDFMINQLTELTNGAYDFEVPLSGVGGFLAIQTGLIDYCSIIISGWGLYWFVCIFSRTMLKRPFLGPY